MIICGDCKEKKEPSCNKKLCKSCNNNRTKINYYRRKFGIELDREKMLCTYSVIEWYEFMYTNKINKMPKEFINKESFIEIIRYVIYKKLKLYDKKDIINVFDYNFISNYKLKTSMRQISSKLCEIVDICFPELSIKPWELNMTSVNYFKSEQNIIDAIDCTLLKEGIELEDLDSTKRDFDEMFSGNGLACLIQTYFKGSHELIKWYLNKKGIIVNEHSFWKKANGYWDSVDNIDYQMKKYINEIIADRLLEELDHNVSYFLTKDVIYNRGYSSMYRRIFKYYDSIQQCFLTNFKSCKLTLGDFIPLSLDGKTKLNSYQEKLIFDYAKFELNLNIESTGVNRKNGLYNEIYNEKYYPDFLIRKQEKEVIVEFYGLYYEGNENSRISAYVEKTKRKNEFYKFQSFEFIALYPEDMKFNMAGVCNKLNNLL